MTHNSVFNNIWPKDKVSSDASESRQACCRLLKTLTGQIRLLPSQHMASQNVYTLARSLMVSPSQSMQQTAQSVSDHSLSLENHFCGKKGPIPRRLHFNGDALTVWSLRMMLSLKFFVVFTRYKSGNYHQDTSEQLRIR
jgi:hypothetical protein